MNTAEIVIALVRGAIELLNLAAKAKGHLQKTHEWTAEEDAAYNAHLESLFKAPHWQKQPNP